MLNSKEQAPLTPSKKILPNCSKPLFEYTIHEGIENWLRYKTL